MTGAPLPVPTHALTLWQPWASFIAHGAKRIETRGWTLRPADRPETIAIHAARRPVEWWPVGRELAAATIPSTPPLEATLGCIVAVARLVTIERTETIVERMRAEPRLVLPSVRIDTHGEIGWQVPRGEARLGDFSAGRYGWWLADVVPLAMPLRCRGAQKLWGIPDDVRALLATQVAPLYADDAEHAAA